MDFNVRFTWYDDEKIWLATSSTNQYALTLDHGSFDALLERVKIAIYDIAEHECGHNGEIRIKLEIERTVNMNIAAIA